MISRIANINMVIIIISVCKIYAELDDDRPNDDASESLDSESLEVFNVSSREKPIRVRNEEVKRNNQVTENIKYVSTCEFANISSPKENIRKNKQALSNYPYSVSIQRKGSHYASGALIHQKWILSTAREFYNIRETIKLFRARCGSVNCKKGGLLIPLKGIEIHPSYIYNQPSFDLGMLRMGQPVKCSEYIKPISLSNKEGTIISAKFLATYWPRLIVNGKVLTSSAKERVKQNSMRVSTQRMIPWDDCYELVQTYNYTLEESSLCLEPIVSHHSSCMPDVGAPIIADDGLWGVTSGWISEDCMTSPSPTIFTRISSEPTRSWLESLIDTPS